MPSILFIHENFPAQFGGIARYLATRGWRVVFATAAEHVPPDGKDHLILPGVHVVGYRRARETSVAIHPYLTGTEQAVLNAQAFCRVGAALSKGGFTPDIVVAHSGWGSGSLARIVWPDARFVQYLEWWYNANPVEAAQPPKLESPENHAAQNICKNLPFLLDAQSADAIQVPTRFQADQLPDILKPRVQVLHDGIDADFFRPAPSDDPQFSFKNLPDDARIVTYATRGMEPMRGFPQFMQAWANLQHKWPDTHCVIAGADQICYGTPLPDGDSYKRRMLAQYQYDHTRLHFTGLLPKPRYRDLLRRSSAHVYLTRPFVLSWSLIEAMLTAAPIVASDTGPVREAAPDDTVRLVNMTQPDQITAAIDALLVDPTAAKEQGHQARKHAERTYCAAQIWPRLEQFYLSQIEKSSHTPQAVAS